MQTGLVACALSNLEDIRVDAKGGDSGTSTRTLNDEWTREAFCREGNDVVASLQRCKGMACGVSMIKKAKAKAPF